MQPHDTIKFSKDNIVEKTIDRSNIWMAQTPQAFNKQKILEAYSSREFDDLVVTDESSLMEKLGYKIMIVPGLEKISKSQHLTIGKELRQNSNDKSWNRI